MPNVARALALLFVALSALAGCRPTETKLLGSWDAPAIDATNRFTFSADHTFEGVSDGMAGMLPIKGVWHIEGTQLVITYDGSEPI